MATVQHFGAAEFEWDAGVYNEVHLLAVPVTTNAPAGGFVSIARRRRWAAYSADLRTRTVFVLDSGVDEVVVTIRYDDQPVQLRAFLRAGLDGADVIYRHYGPGGDEIPCQVVEVVGAGADEELIKPDRERWQLGEWETTIRLRRVDGGTFEGIL